MAKKEISWAERIAKDLEDTKEIRERIKQERILELQKAAAEYLGVYANESWDRTEVGLGDEEIEIGQARAKRRLESAMEQLGWSIERTEDGYTDILNEELGLRF